MKIVELPSELLLLIRDNIFELSEFSKEMWDVDSSLNDFMRRECRWSWRNFLSATNSVLWQQMRKASMVWDLNHYATRKYLAEESFRDYINNRMIDPSMQLQLNCYQIESYEVIRNSIPAPLYLSSFIGGFDSLHSLILTYCPNIISLGNFKSLRTLVIKYCSNFAVVGETPNLSEVCLISLPLTAFPSLPLENLRKLRLLLQFSSDWEILCSVFPRLQNLREFGLFATCSDVYLTLNSVPQLESLDVYNCHSVDLTGQTRLTSFKFRDIYSIIGKELIFPQLHSLDCFQPNPYIEKNIKKFTSLKKFRYMNDSTSFSQEILASLAEIHSFTDLSLLSDSFLEKLDISPTVRSLEIVMTVETLQVEDNNQFFQKVSLNSSFLRDISMFQNVYELELCSNVNIKNIDCFQNIPYLTISSCPHIKSFACFRNSGKQRYLSISGNSHLNNEDIKGFGKIYYLRFDECGGITKISGLINTRYFLVCRLKALKGVILEGMDYVHVSMALCPKLSEMMVTGKINNLTVSSCPELKRNEIGNYERLRRWKD
jgi:hypothetical protein